MRIAVVGSGSAGLVCAWALQDAHDVVVFEAADRPGGHAHTVVADADGGPVHAEIGAEFFFEEGYGGLLALIDRLGLHRERTSLAVSMTFDDPDSTFVMPPHNLASTLSCASPSTVRDLLALRRVAIAAEKVADARDWSVSVNDLLERTRIPPDVAERVIVSLIASSWGVPREMARELAAYSVVSVMGLRLRHKPHGIRLVEGLSSYVQRLVADSPRVDLRLSTPVKAVELNESQLTVVSERGAELFDHVVLACDWHNSAAICRSSARLGAWHDAFSQFPDYATTVALHRDVSYMPRKRALWGIANFSLPSNMKPRTTVWSGILSGRDLFRTWLRDGEEPPASTSHTATYRHIVVSTDHPRRQAALAALQGQGGVWAAGMYTTGIDNHESAIRSGLRVAEQLAPDAERVRWLASHVSS